jgi:uncharacterized membrane protein YeaQ/YmgE (transglycosylase-associated protein family)
MLIGIIGWLVCGALLGFMATKLINLHGDDPRLGIGIAAVGGLVGGWLYSLLSGAGVSAFNVWSVICAAVVSLVGLIVWHIVRSRSPHVRPSIRRSY